AARTGLDRLPGAVVPQLLQRLLQPGAVAALPHVPPARGFRGWRVGLLPAGQPRLRGGRARVGLARDARVAARLPPAADGTGPARTGPSWASWAVPAHPLSSAGPL